MTYHKREPATRQCAHCQANFVSNHQSRLYCCQSCNTLAWRARQPAAPKAKVAPDPTPAPASETLAFSAQNMALLTLGSTVGTLAAQGITAVGQHLFPGHSELDQLRAEMRAGFAFLGVPATLKLGDLPRPPAALAPGAAAAWLPAELRAVRAPLVTLQLNGQAPAAFVRLIYHGHALYHCLATGLVLWERTPNQYWQLHSAAALASLAARPVGPEARSASGPALAPRAAPLVAPEPGYRRDEAADELAREEFAYSLSLSLSLLEQQELALADELALSALVLSLPLPDPELAFPDFEQTWRASWPTQELTAVPVADQRIPTVVGPSAPPALSSAALHADA